MGAGITGLTAAYRLARARHSGAPVDPIVIESAERPGGLIQTERVEGFLVEAGPDSFLTEKPEASALINELGLGGNLIGSNDAEKRTYILHRGHLVPLSEAFSLFVPRQLRALFSPLVTPPSKIAMLRERFLRPRPAAAPELDEPASWFVERHFGRGVLENIAEPLLAAIYGADVDRLSTQSALPSFYALERAYGSLIRGVALNRLQHPRAPLFTTPRGGMQDVINSLAGALNDLHESREQPLVFEERAARIERRNSADGGYRLICERGSVFDADVVISTVPAPETGKLVESLDPGLAESFSEIRYTPAVTVSLAYPKLDLPRGFGFVVPVKESRRLLACTFVHSKFAGRVPRGAAMLRCFLGGARNPGVMQLDDGDLVSLVLRELRSILGVTAPPHFHRCYRHSQAMPQYHVGHGDLVREIEQAAGKLPGFFFAGNAYHGVGISDCIRGANSAAERAVEYARERAGA